MAEEPIMPGLTINEAIAMAIKQSEAIKKAEVEIDRTDALRERAAEQVDYIPTGGKGYNSLVEATWAASLQADMTWRISKKAYDAKLDGIALDVCNQYWEVIKTKEKVKVNEIKAEKAGIELQKSRAAYQLGIVGNISQETSFKGLEQAESEMTKAASDLESAKNELAQAYLKLNQLVGLSAVERPFLADDIEFHPLNIVNLEAEVNRALAKSPLVWQAEQGVELQYYVHNLLRATGEYKPYDARQAEKKQAELDAINAKEATKILVRDLYYQILNLEESYKSAQRGITVVEESLRVTELMYEVGMATKADVVAAKVTLAEAQKGLKDLAVAHTYAKLVFQKPWAPMYTTSS